MRNVYVTIKKCRKYNCLSKAITRMYKIKETKINPNNQGKKEPGREEVKITFL